MWVAVLAMTWLGVTMGEPAAGLKARLGDPVLITKFPDDLVASGGTALPGMPDERKARYLIPGTDFGFLVVTERNGYVAGLQAFHDGKSGLDRVSADPNGVTLGMTEADVLKHAPGAVRRGDDLRVAGDGDGAFTQYTLKDGVVRNIIWNGPLHPDGTPLPPLTAPDGLSTATAIDDGMTDERAGVRWEYLYLFLHPCAPDTRWKRTTQGLSTNGGRRYDVLHVTCPQGGAERDFVFDITRFYGKF